MALTPLTSSALPAGELSALPNDTWARIGRGLNGRWPAWALPVVATNGSQGPSARVLALRAADGATRTLVFHCDARSEKVRQLAHDPRVAVTFWDAADGIEARFCGGARIHRGDDVAAAAWREVSPLRKLASASVLGPGTRLQQSQRFDAIGDSDHHDGFGNFAVLHVRVHELDWLWVGADDMRRATFLWTGAAWDGAWIVP